MPQEKDFPDFGTDLVYFNRTRREFLKLGSLAVAGLLLSDVVRPSLSAGASVRTMRSDRAVALALRDAGARVVTHVPATGAVAVFDAVNELAGTKPVYSFNEETAYTVAHGAALSGARAAAVLKAHGLAKAANSVIDSLTLGTTGGFVTVALDDPEGAHSDNIFPLQDFLRGTGIPFKRAGRETIYDDVLECFLWSEKLTVPVVLFVDSRELSREAPVLRKTLPPVSRRYSRDALRHVLCPPLAPYQRRVLEAKLAGKDWRSISEPVLPPVPQGLPAAWRQAAAQFVPVFEIFQALRAQIDFVGGDTGLSSLFAFPPFACVDACSYYGGSLPLAIGAFLGGPKRVWAVTGDYAFLAAGHLGLIEAQARRIPLKVLILDNGRAMATGGQPVPEGLLERVLGGWTSFVRRIDTPADPSAVREALSRAQASQRLEIVHAVFRG